MGKHEFINLPLISRESHNYFEEEIRQNHYPIIVRTSSFSHNLSKKIYLDLFRLLNNIEKRKIGEE